MTVTGNFWLHDEVECCLTTVAVRVDGGDGPRPLLGTRGWIGVGIRVTGLCRSPTACHADGFAGGENCSNVAFVAVGPPLRNQLVAQGTDPATPDVKPSCGRRCQRRRAVVFHLFCLEAPNQNLNRQPVGQRRSADVGILGFGDLNTQHIVAPDCLPRPVLRHILRVKTRRLRTAHALSGRRAAPRPRMPSVQGGPCRVPGTHFRACKPLRS